VSIVVLGAYFLVYQQIGAKSDKTKAIWVPPKAKPTLPFGLGPAPEPVKPEEYEQTTYHDYETKQLKDGVQQIVMGGALSFFMAMKFNIMISLLMQVINLPLNLYDNVLFKKYLLGVTKKEDGSLLYGELFAAPTAESLAAADRIRANIAAATESTTEKDDKSNEKLTPSVAVSAIAPGEARVEVLDEDEKTAAKDE
jgi:hypothetical protein